MPAKTRLGTASQIIVLIIAALSLPCSAQQAGQGTGRFFVKWWSKENIHQFLEMAPQDLQTLQDQLNRVTIEFQVTRTSMHEARAKLRSMYTDASATKQTISAFYEREVKPLEAKMTELRVQARLRLIEATSVEQRQAVLKKYPRFFGARWLPIHHIAVKEITPQ